MTTSPSHILIVGAGEFGISTCLALLRRPAFSNSRITILESSPTIPNPSGSSVDANRIIRADYASRPYAVLASQAQVFWRDQSDSGWGGQGRYTESGFVLTAHQGAEAYVEEALCNVKSLAAQGLPLLAEKIEELPDKAAVKRATGYKGVSGDKGYANWNSGWAHAEKVMLYAIDRVKREGAGRVQIRSGAKVERLLEDGKGAVVNGDVITADLTIVAGGAWTPSLIDLKGRCLATGQVMAYIKLAPEEQAELETTPVIMNLSNGMFIIPPKGDELKIARHAFGYTNPKKTRFGEVSVPRVGVSIPSEGEKACREALGEFLPDMANRPFERTRICWYCDTPDGNFLIDFHPDFKNVLIATGGSGHGFKFFPVIGEKIVDRIEGNLDQEYQHLWRWKSIDAQFDSCNDGSRSGRKGLVLDSEYI